MNNEVGSDFCSTADKDQSDTKNEGQNEETSKEVTGNCESGGNKTADNTPLTLDEKTQSDKYGKNEEFMSNSPSVNDANKNENEPMNTTIRRQLEDEIQSHLQHVPTAKKENENNSQSNLHAMVNLDKSNSDAITQQVNLNECLFINYPLL